MRNHISDAEAAFLVTNVTPDFCRVNNAVVPFEIMQLLAPEKSAYSSDVTSRGKKVLKMGSAVAGTIGNMGKGVISQVAEGSGHTLLIEGEPTILVDGAPIVRHNNICLMNVKL